MICSPLRRACQASAHLLGNVSGRQWKVQDFGEAVLHIYSQSARAPEVEPLHDDRAYRCLIARLFFLDLPAQLLLHP